MRSPRPRLTVRRLMVAVAFVAIIFGLGVTWQRRQQFRRLAGDFALKERLALEFGGADRRHSRMYHHDNATRESWEFWTDHADYYSAMARKYERAARYPWLPIDPDPPEPK